MAEAPQNIFDHNTHFYALNLKAPSSENDDMFLILKNFKVAQEIFQRELDVDPYLKLKYDKFKDLDLTFLGYDQFKDKTSLKKVGLIEDWTATVYTYSAIKNNLKLNEKQYLEMISKSQEQKVEIYKNFIQSIKDFITQNPNTRRCVIRFASHFNDYVLSENDKSFDADVSCLLYIHYLKDSVKIVFRAIDLKDEAFVDLMLLYNFFIKPIYGDKANISIYSSTVQNIDAFQKFIMKLISVHYEV